MSKLKTFEHQSAVKVDKRLWLILFGCITFVVLVCYGSTLAYGVVFHDELSLLLLNNQSARNHPGLADVIMRPLTQPWVRQSFLLDESNYATTFGWYHLVNVYFHWLSSVALFGLVFRLVWRWRNDGLTAADPYKLSAAAALLFACHPLTVQPAAYLSARYACLGACNYLMALNCFLVGLFGVGSLRVWGYIVCWAFGWMCLGSSEVGLTLAPAMLAVFFLAKPSRSNWKDWACDHPYICGLLIALTICAPFSLVFGLQPAALPNLYGTGSVFPAQYYATQAKSLVSYYLRCFLVPLGLSIDPPYAQATTLTDPLSILGFVALAGLVGALVYFRRRPLLTLGLLLTLLGVLPHFSIPQVELVADPVFYLALSGLVVVVVALLEPLFAGTWQSAGEKVVPLLIVLSGLSIFHSLDFRDDKALAAQTLKVNARSAVAHTLLATAAYAERNYDLMLAQSNQALSIDPADALAWLSKGEAINKKGDYAVAEGPLKEAVSQTDKQHLALQQIAQLALAENYIELNKVDDADLVMKTALYEDPNNPEAIYILGRISLSRQAYGPAAMYLQRAFRMGVTAALQPLAECALRLHKYSDAVRVAQEAVSMDNSDRSKLMLANALLGAKETDMAQSVVTAVLKESPGSAYALAMQSVIEEHTGKAQAAKEHKEQAIKLDPHAFDQVVAPAP